jgi:hypothetical protein
MGASVPNPALERTARKLRLRVPSSLRSSAAAQRERWASSITTPLYFDCLHS